ncbi:hypothetical protein BB561_001615 [Smittium simulii]|uniref:Uncharacterized protein n=1 Tax=Smittium simulii TaxID=133385 RepID=A0A2T9YTV6_9FUNG|nr:hypothetical protein BB561_003081 [Smittium simulii]PVU95773.1 hypothetical protein BB561_001615 [Smittium simulii]
MPKVPGVISSAAAGMPYHSAKRTRLEYSTVAKTGLIDPVPKNDYYFNFSQKNSQKTQVSYTNAAKNQKKVTYDATVYKEVSIKHFLDNSESHQLKRMCMGGSDRRIGCSWRQFPDNLNEALDYVTDATGDSCVTIEHDNIRKITYFQFDELNEDNCFFKIPIHYSWRQVDLFRAVNIDKDITVLFKKNYEKIEIPNLIEVGGEFIPITYRGCQPICSFCKKSRYWKSDCSIISGSKKQILKPEPKAQGKPNQFAKNLVKNKPNQFQSNGAVKQMQDKINNFLGNSKNQQINNGWSEVIPEKPNTNFSEKNKKNANSLDKAQKKVFESLTPNANNKILNMHIKKHKITQDETQIAIKLEFPDNNNGLFTDNDLSSNISYPSSPVAIDMIEPEPNKDNYVGRINIGLI